MTQLAAKSSILKLVELNPSELKWHVPLFHAICIGTPLLTCLFLDKFEYALLATLPTVVALYYPEKLSTANKMLSMFLCSFAMIISVTIGLLFNFNSVVAVVVFGVFSTSAHWVANYYKLHNPRSYFFILATSVMICMPSQPDKIPLMVGLVAIGTISTCIITLIYSLITRNSDDSPNKVYISFDNNFDVKQSLVVGLFMSISLFTAFYFELNKPYWVPIACLTILQGVSFSHVKIRSFHRMLGTTIGMGIVWLILLFITSPLGGIISVMALLYIIGTLLPRNYGLAVIFITPLSLILAELNASGTNITVSTMGDRLLANIIGCAIGIIGGWIIYKMDKKAL